MMITYLVKETIAVGVSKLARLVSSGRTDDNIDSNRSGSAGCSYKSFEKHHLCDQKTMDC